MDGKTKKSTQSNKDKEIILLLKRILFFWQHVMRRTGNVKNNLELKKTSSKNKTQIK